MYQPVTSSGKRHQEHLDRLHLAEAQAPTVVERITLNALERPNSVKRSALRTEPGQRHAEQPQAVGILKLL